MSIYKIFFHAQGLPLRVRRTNRQAVGRAMAETPAAFAAHLKSIFAFYGTEARRFVFGPRKNEIARAGQLIAAVAYGCPADWAAQAWKSLTTEQKRAVDSAVRGELEELGGGTESE